MAPTTPPSPGGGIPRPLPRGGRVSSGRNTRPRFQTMDAAWMAALCALFIGLMAAVHGHHWLGVGTVALTYLVGWRASGRAAGVIAGLLLATSAVFLRPTGATLMDDAFTLLSVAALFAFVAGSSLAALGLAGAAALTRPEGLLLGVLLLTLSVAQRRQRAAWGAALFLTLALGGWTALALLLHQRPSLPTLSPHTDLLRWTVAPATVFLTWFILPFCGEIGEPMRRARWLAVILWTGLYLLLGSLVRLPHHSAAGLLLGLLPLWFLLAATGLARLLPALTGDIPAPALRYTIATLTVLSLIAIRARVEWQHPTPPSPAISLTAAHTARTEDRPAPNLSNG